MMKNVKLCILYAPPHIIRTSKQNVGWSGRVAGKRQNKIRRCFHWKKYENSLLQDRVVDDNKLKRILNKQWKSYGLD